MPFFPQRSVSCFSFSFFQLAFLSARRCMVRLVWDIPWQDGADISSFSVLSGSLGSFSTPRLGVVYSFVVGFGYIWSLPMETFL
jgi:hypothetical protein